MDEMLVLLLRKCAHAKPVRITTTELGRMLGMSQQNASRRLAELEKEGFVLRGKDGLSITKRGLEDAYSVYATLKGAFEKASVRVSGKIVSGLGEGKYYMSFPQYKKQITDSFGFAPYEGTLNVKLSAAESAKKAHRLKDSEPTTIYGFKKGERTFGDLFAYACTVDGVNGALVVPLRTHHPSEIIEIVSAANLKKQLGKKDGDEVEIKFE